jgi:hypothetical protein
MEILKQYRNTRYYAKEDGTIINKQWNRELVHSVNELGYHRIHPRLKGKRMNLFVHRVVAECFIPNPDNKPFVLHKDNNPRNNHVSNLKWGTQSENIQQAYDDKRISAKGENNGQSKLTDVDVKIIREARAIGFQGRKIAMYYKMSESWIYQICRGERWGHLCA